MRYINKKNVLIGITLLIVILFVVFIINNKNDTKVNIKNESIVKKNTKPIITIIGENIIELEKGEEYIEKGSKATDSDGNDITNDIKITNNININKYGEYKVIYEVSDKYGNKAIKLRKVIVKDKILPEIKLKGRVVIDILLGEDYTEEGYSAIDNIDGDITDKVVIDNKVDNKKIGNYKITYKVSDTSGNTVTRIRNINVVNKLLEYKSEYDKIDNTINGWWSGNKFDNKRPDGAANIDDLKKYNAYFMGPDEKKIYLTYDEGANDTYLPQIVDVLNKYNVKATFFLCRNYMNMNKNLIRKMVESGHSIGNHTYHHYSMPTLANKKDFDSFIYEIKSTETTYEEITGKKMDKVYREPKGEWSYRSLAIIKDLGYKTFFYSADYLDFKSDVSKSYALDKMMKRYHNGAIYLFHPKNKGNYEALSEFIENMKKLGYTFDLVKNIDY